MSLTFCNYQLFIVQKKIYKYNCYLLLEQWHLPLEEEILPAERAWSWHFLRWADERGGFPVDRAWVPKREEDPPCFPLETLPSAVTEDKKEDVVVPELKQSFEYWLPNDKSFLDSALGRLLVLTKSRLSFWGSWTIGRTGTGLEGGEEVGPRRKRAWPVRFKMEMTCLNLATVKSVISLQSSWWLCWGWLESAKIKCSMLFIPADAASCIAIWSSILEYPSRSTAMMKKKKSRTKPLKLAERERDGGEGCWLFWEWEEKMGERRGL